MSRRSPRKHYPVKRLPNSGHAWWFTLGIIAIIALGVLALAFTRSGTDRSASAGGLRETGETSSMGTPVVETPGSGSGVATAAGVEVTGANYALGRVPLLVAVRPTWKLQNTSATTVTLGEPHPEIRKGCCPGPFTFGSPTLAPGASTTLSFELSMHPGMDGPHDIGVHVPVQPEGGPSATLDLNVTGDFRGGSDHHQH